MAIRYLAVVQQHADKVVSTELVERISINTNLRPVFQNRTTTIFVDPSADYLVMPDNAGIIVGYLFSSRGSFDRVRTISSKDAQIILSADGRGIIGSYWGGFVGLVCDPEGTGVQVIRDPSGSMPCYYSQAFGATVICSDVETLFDAGLLQPEVDWNFLLRHLFAYELRIPRTGLVGVKEVLAGFCLRITSNELSVSQCWSPWDHVSHDAAQPESEMMDRLREVTIGCIRAWGDCFSHILTLVSGGLDSSIVAYAMNDRPTRQTCLTMATDEPDGDERRYARILTDSLSAKLLERFHRLEHIDVTKSTAAHLPRPLLLAFAQSDRMTKSEIASQLRIDAIFTGHGGDNVFCHILSATSALDRLKAEGFGMGFWSAVEDVCQLTSCTTWDALLSILRRVRKNDPAYLWATDGKFLSLDAIRTSRFDLQHPWLTPPNGALPGKAAHVASLLRIQGTIDGYSRKNMPPQISPLLSQPIVETCLHIPTWKWCAGGRNRSAIRGAFDGLLPKALIERKSKGGPGSFAFEVIDNNKATLRDLLLGGHLARHGLLDCQALQKVFDDPKPINGQDYLRIGALAEAEVWSIHWANRPFAPPNNIV